jgi:ATP-dependent protease Clp ATPase subunit
MAVLLEIELDDPSDFLVIRETLTRMGHITSDDQFSLEQMCHILHKRGRYYVIHNKELMQLDGIAASLTYDDELVRNTIAFLLKKWGLCQLVDEDLEVLPVTDTRIKVVSFKEKSKWKLYCPVQ